MLALVAALTPAAHGQSSTAPPMPPEVRRALDAPYLTDDERADLAVFHGLDRPSDRNSPARIAAAAIIRGDYGHAIFDDAQAPIEDRAEARLRRGELRACCDLLVSVSTIRARRIRAEALLRLGDVTAAHDVVESIAEALDSQQLDDVARFTEAVRATTLRLTDDPARDYQRIIDRLDFAHQQMDRLHWPAYLVEAEVLFGKHQVEAATEALHGALSRNPRLMDAWYLLGRIAVDQYDVQRVARIASAMRSIEPNSPQIGLLEAEMLLRQDDPAVARDALAPVLARFPTHRGALALHAACDALSFDWDGTDAALARFDKLSPTSAQAYYVVGRHLADARQYAAAARYLDEAIARRPNWPDPQVVQGLMAMQSGQDDAALASLQRIREIDPFDRRVANSLHLIETLTNYETAQSEHFIVRYQPGVDGILAQEMLSPLEEIHDDVCSAMQHEPSRKTLIELMPDREWFAVRVTGMPGLHTIAACTGPVIAMQTPRRGPRSDGPYDWMRVLRHEYTHTVTLSQTANRIPHWLTEGLAVHMESAPRGSDAAHLLTHAHRTGTLFTLDEMNEAFIHPRRATDRAQAYAQAQWTIQYVIEAFGQEAVIALLDAHHDGLHTRDAAPAALGISQEELATRFQAWAAMRVKEWGMAPQPSLRELTIEHMRVSEQYREQYVRRREVQLDVAGRRLMRDITSTNRPDKDYLRRPLPPMDLSGIDFDDAVYAAWLDRYPDHPDALAHLARKAASKPGPLDDAAVELLRRLADARSVDPFPHQRLAEHHLALGQYAHAIEHLAYLDARAVYRTTYGEHLVRCHRKLGDLTQAQTQAERLVRIDPFNAGLRELAAAVALQAGDDQRALHHVEALIRIEPDRARHEKRLKALQARLAASTDDEDE